MARQRLMLTLISGVGWLSKASSISSTSLSEISRLTL